MTDTKELITELSEYLHDTDCSYNGLAAAIGVSPRQLKSWLEDECTPSHLNVGRIRKFLQSGRTLPTRAEAQAAGRAVWLVPGRVL